MIVTDSVVHIVVPRGLLCQQLQVDLFTDCFTLLSHDTLKKPRKETLLHTNFNTSNTVQNKMERQVLTLPCELYLHQQDHSLCKLHTEHHYQPGHTGVTQDAPKKIA